MAASSLPANVKYAAAVAIAHRRLIHRLRDDGKGDALQLADILEACSRRRPCRSAACPTCVADFQLVAFDLFKTLIKTPARAIRGRVRTETIVPSVGCVSPSDLSIDVIERVKTDIAAALADCDIPATFGTIEISFNEDKEGDVSSHWCVHAHTTGLNWLTVKQVKDLRRHFPKSDLVRRPVKHQALDGDLRGILYPFKPLRSRRVSYIETLDNGRAPYRATRSYSLRPWQSVDLALIEHAIGFAGRLIMHGIDQNAVSTAVDAFRRARDSPN